MTATRMALVGLDVALAGALGRALAHHGAIVMIVVPGAGAGALEEADAVVTDLDARADAVALLDTARRESPRAERILVGSERGLDARRALDDHTAGHFFQKPFGLDDVARMVTIARRRPA